MERDVAVSQERTAAPDETVASRSDRSAGSSAMSVGSAVAQAKLTVGAVADPLEAEADAVADRVVRKLAGRPSPSGPVHDARMDAVRVQRSATVGATGGDVDQETERAINSSRRRGRVMRAETRERMESAFGADFGSVRVHEGPVAQRLNERIQAKAFTVGSDIYFRGRASDAGTGAHDDRLLAHELAHTVQQGGAVARRIQRDPGAAPPAVPARTGRPSLPSRPPNRPPPAPPGQAPAPPVPPAPPTFTSIDYILAKFRGLAVRDGVDPARLFEPEVFKLATKTRGHQRGAAQKAIDTYLVQFAKAPATDHAARQKVLLRMQYATEQWLIDHAVQDEAGEDVTRHRSEAVPGSDEWLMDPKRKKRFAGMVAFHGKVMSQLGAVQTELRASGADVTTDLAGFISSDTDPTSQKISLKYTGSPTSTLTKLGALIDMAVPNAGDATSIEIAFQWPVGPSVFVGGTLRLSAQNESPPGSAGGAQAAKNITARAELVVTAGGSVGVAKLQGEIGGYIEASAKSGRDCTTLMSYALFRRCRESYIVPRGFTNRLWGGGRGGRFGALKAEKWGRDTEKAFFSGADNENYVETGMVAGVSAEVEAGEGDWAVGGGGGLTFGRGTRYDQQGIEGVKGAVGARNKKRKAGQATTTQQNLGRRTTSFGVEGEVSVGPITISGGLSFQWMSEKGLGSDWRTGASRGNAMSLEASEMEVSITGSVPSGGSADKAVENFVGYAFEGAKLLVAKIRAIVEARQAKLADDRATGLSPKERKRRDLERKRLGKASISGEMFTSLFDGLDQVQHSPAIASQLNPVGPDPAHTFESSIGVNATFGFDFTSKEGAFSINFVKSREFSIPGMLDISQEKSTRMVQINFGAGKPVTFS